MPKRNYDWSKHYAASNTARKLRRAATKEQRKAVCSGCSKYLTILGKGLCTTCYHKLHEISGVCSKCGNTGTLKNKRDSTCTACCIKIQNDVGKEYRRQYYQTNKKAINAKAIHRQHVEPKVMLVARLRKRLAKVLRRNSRCTSTVKLLGCTLDFFAAHIKSLFAAGMSFSNYGKWHLDHIIPCAAWDLADPEQQKMCFHYSNLRPAWSQDNLEKAAKTPSWFNLEDYLEAFEPFKQQVLI